MYVTTDNNEKWLYLLPLSNNPIIQLFTHLNHKPTIYLLILILLIIIALFSCEWHLGALLIHLAQQERAREVGGFIVISTLKVESKNLTVKNNYSVSGIVVCHQLAHPPHTMILKRLYYYRKFNVFVSWTHYHNFVMAHTYFCRTIDPMSYSTRPSLLPKFVLAHNVVNLYESIYSFKATS